MLTASHDGDLSRELDANGIISEFRKILRLIKSCFGKDKNNLKLNNQQINFNY